MKISRERIEECLKLAGGAGVALRVALDERDELLAECRAIIWDCNGDRGRIADHRPALKAIAEFLRGTIWEKANG